MSISELASKRGKALFLKVHHNDADVGMERNLGGMRRSIFGSCFKILHNNIRFVPLPREAKQ